MGTAESRQKAAEDSSASYDPTKIYITDDISKAVRNEDVEPLLRRQMEENHCDELLDFYIAAQHIQVMQLARTSDEVIMRNITRIHEQFLQDHAPRAVNLHPTNRDIIQPTLAASVERLRKAQDECLLVIRKGVWRLFLEGPYGVNICVVDEETAMRYRMEGMARSLGGAIVIPVERDSANAMAIALQNENIQAMFMRYMVMKFCDELLEFYLVADQIIRHSRTEDPQKTFQKLKEVVNMFIYDGSERAANIDTVVRMEIIQCVEQLDLSEGDTIAEAVLLLRIARDEAYKLIMHTHWQTFLKTKVGQLIKFESDRNPRVSLAW